MEPTRPRTPPTLLSRALWASLVLLLFAAPLFVGLGRRDMQNDESIYSYAVESILETGDWLNPRSSPDPDAIFLEKPPLKFWIVALPIRLGLLPHDEFGLRFWDAAFGALAFLYVFALGRRLSGAFCGITACLWLFAFTPLIFEHGLRSNNMEAPLLLAYCGGVFHFLRWSDSTDARTGWRHALAVAGYCYLGFMTKFVAVVFLPMVLLAAAALHANVRKRLVAAWRTWAGVTGLALAAAAPWFVYQSLHPKRGVWTIMLGEHVMRRMSTSLDPAHLHPWHYYFTFLFQWLDREGGVALACAGALLLLVRTVRRRRLDGTVVLLWFALPVPLISIGASKLGHYLYPYLPPVALAAGYALGWAFSVPVDLVEGRRPGWLERGWTRTGARLRQDRLAALAGAARVHVTRAIGRVPRGLTFAVRAALAAAAVGWLILALVVLFHQGRLMLAGVTLARGSRFGYLLFFGLAAAVAAGYGRLGLRAALLILLLSITPLNIYRRTLPELLAERHPLHDARACMSAVRAEEARAGRTLPPVFAFVPNDFIHSYFFYLRSAGWEWHYTMSAAELEEMVGAEARPVLLGRTSYDQLWRPFARTGAKAPQRVSLDNVLLLLPGAYGRCATD